jgi:hypothetical protein
MSAVALPPPAVYGNSSPQERAGADKDRQFRTWALAFRSGSSKEKEAARKAVSRLNAADRAEFEKFCKAYGIDLQ